MDKHAADGIGQMDEKTFRRDVWFHYPITDIWGIGPGIARRLARAGVHDPANICATDPAWLRGESGRNAEWLIDHAWGARALYHRGRAGLRAQGTIALQRPGAHARLRLWRGARCAARDGLAKLSRPQAAGARMRHDGTLRGTLGAGRTFRARWWTEGPWTPDCWRAGGDRGAFALYDQTVARDLPIRRVCLWLGGVAPAAVAVPTLFDDPTADAREARLAGAVTRTQRRFGPNTVLSGTSLLPAANARERNLQIGGHRA